MGGPNSFILPIVFKPISVLVCFKPIDFLGLFFFFWLGFSGVFKKPISFKGAGMCV